MKSLISRWIRSESFLWSSVLAVTVLYANWLWHCDTRQTHRIVKGWAGRVVAYLPTGNDASRRATHEAAAKQADVAKSVALSRLRDLPAPDTAETGQGRFQNRGRLDPTLGFESSEQTIEGPPRARRELRQPAFQPAHEVARAAPNSQLTGGAEPDAPIDRDVLGATSFEEGLRWFRRSDYRQAAQAFQAAASHVPDDARSQYFLALSQHFSGKRAEADRSLAQAVQLEASRPLPDLGRLLERVQGPVRNWLEDARRKARVGPYAPRD